MDEITEYLMFAPTRARAAGTRRDEAPSTASRQGNVRANGAGHAPPEAVRGLLADPDVLAALLRLAEG